jgi:integrase
MGRSLRHFVASLLESKNVPIKKIQLILGHSKPTTTDRYLSELKGEKSGVMAVISEKLHMNTTHSEDRKEEGGQE